MARFAMQVAVAADSVLPRDRIVNVLHFDRPAALPDNPDALCLDLANIYNANLYGPNTNEIDVRLYNETVPGPPLGRAVINPGLARGSQGPREVGLTLSFRGATNTPSTRGRIFICTYAMNVPTQGLRPTTEIMDKLLTAGDAIAALGGVDIDWGVYSPTNLSFVKTEYMWVDDEWDTVRSRGLRSTSRRGRAVQ